MTRYRHMVLTPDAYTPAVVRNRSNGTSNWTSGTPWQVHTRYHVRDMWDQVTPDFQKRKNRGDIVINSMESIVHDISVNPFHLWVGYGTNGRQRSDSGVGAISVKWPLYTVVPDDLVQDAITEAVTMARAKLAAPGFAGITAIAELKETLDLLKSPLAYLHRKTTRYAHRIKRARERHRRRAEYLQAFEAREAERARKWLKHKKSMSGFEPRQPPKWSRTFNRDPNRDPELLKTISSLWLTYRYGIMPLVYSVQDALKAAAQAEVKVRETGRGQVETQHSLTEEMKLPVDGYNGYQYGTTNVYSSEIRVRGFCIGEYVTSFSQAFGLQLSDIPLALWEGTPLSFVADWFFNIGEFLSALTTDMRANVLGCGVTVEVTTTVSCTSSLAVQSGFVNFGDSDGKQVYTGTSTHKYRVPKSILDIGLVARVEMNAQRYADAAALIHQRLTRKKV